MIAFLLCLAPIVIDGDSIRCRNIGEVRLLGVDAPDYRRSRPCVGGFGDHVCDDRGALRAKSSLRQAVRRGPVNVVPVTRDRYGRTVAMVSASGADLSCHQLRAGVVRYIARYDNGRRIARSCAAAW